jgi:multiple antibiotic resistance protein
MRRPDLGASPVSILAAALGSVIVALQFICYAFADPLALVLGPTGTKVIVKLTSILLVSLGAQIVGNGASQLLRTLPHAG